MLAQSRPAEPRAGGEREALRALIAAREGAVELRGALQALRAVARRLQQLTREERELVRELETLTRTLAPQPS